MRSKTSPVTVVFCALVALTICSCASLSPSPQSTLQRALTFHASFDRGVDADFAQGDPFLYTATSQNSRAAAQRGLDSTNMALVESGRFGRALRFTKKQAPLIFFQAARNLPYNFTNWSGTVSFWLSVDPAIDLEQGFCDPVQITPRTWNDAAFFVEFEKRREIPFRLGVYADYKVWNPENRKWEEIPAVNKPLVTVAKPPFGPGKWTHVVFTFDRFNTGRHDGVAQLYLDGQLAGALPPRLQTFTWDERQTSIMLGLSYVGLFDELSLFNRALTEKEIQTLYALEHGVSGLLSGRSQAK